jgi:hypothetical protein
MKTQILTQDDIDFLNSKAIRTTLTYKVSFIGFILMIPTALFVGYAEGFSGTTAFLGFSVIGLFLNFYFHRIISRNIRIDIKNDV